MRFVLTSAALIAVAACSSEERGDKPVRANQSEVPEVKAIPVATVAEAGWERVIKSASNGEIIVGNPNAAHQITLLTSMTCPSCSYYVQESFDHLLTGPVRAGQHNLSIQPFVRDPLDITMSLMLNCVPDSKKVAYLKDLYAQQERLLTPVMGALPQRLEEIQKLSPVEMFKASAELMGLYATVEPYGVSRAQADSCLADEAHVTKLVKLVSAASSQVTGVPAFIYDGKVQAMGELHTNLNLPMLPGAPMKISRPSQPSATADDKARAEGLCVKKYDPAGLYSATVSQSGMPDLLNVRISDDGKLRNTCTYSVKQGRIIGYGGL